MHKKTNKFHFTFTFIGQKKKKIKKVSYSDNNESPTVDSTVPSERKKITADVRKKHQTRFITSTPHTRRHTKRHERPKFW